jgi:hypothetical protein
LATTRPVRERLLNEVSNRGLVCTISMVPQDPKDFPTQDLSQLGIHTYVSELFNARREVKQYLCEQNKLHLIGVGCPEFSRSGLDAADHQVCCRQSLVISNPLTPPSGRNYAIKFATVVCWILQCQKSPRGQRGSVQIWQQGVLLAR